jgi:hypothetical protein
MLDDSGCLLWTASLNSRGYGLFWKDGKNQLAHRVALELEQQILNGQQVHHICHNPKCVNVDHLQIVDASEHNKSHGKAKLSSAEVSKIKELHLQGLGRVKISRILNIPTGTINNILTGTQWKDANPSSQQLFLFDRDIT